MPSDNYSHETRTNAEQSETADDFRASFESDDDRKMMDALNFDGPSPRPRKLWPKVPRNHIVYFVGGVEGPVKIGWTQQPIKERLKCIQNGSPVKLHVLATQHAPRQREGFYHRLFAKYRLHGEWFERSAEILAEIEMLNG